MSKSRPILIALGVLGSLLLTSPPQVRANLNFDAWLEGFQRDAARSGISEITLKAHLEGLQPIPRVIELDRGQAVRSTNQKGPRPTFEKYLQRVVPKSRVETARQKYAKNRELLQEIGARFDVEPTFVVALWAIESDFGRRTGSFPVVGALATLAHEGRRGPFFRGELIELLKLIDQGAIADPEPRGSWAGAMGQVQFMPSSFKNFALDFDGDGRRDLWNSTADALGSAANYLSRSGWKRGQPWGQGVKLPKNFDPSKAGADQQRTLKTWRRLGVKGISGADSRKAAIVLPDGKDGSAYLVYGNFKALRHWNRSNYFALAVCHLAEQIDPGRTPGRSPKAGAQVVNSGN